MSTTTSSAPVHLTGMFHVLAPGVLSGGYKNQKGSAMAHLTGGHVYVTGGEATAFIVICIVVALLAALAIAVVRIADAF